MPTQVTEVTDHLPTAADMVVIGGGILGATTAFTASRRGLRVVVVERGKRLGGLTTQASAGGYRMQFDTPDEIALLKESLDFWDAFADQVGDTTADLRRTVNGYLWVTRRHDRVAAQKAQVAHQVSMGVDGVEWWNGNDACRRFPYLAEDVAGVRYRAGDGWIDPVRATVALAEGASRHGVVFAFNTTVTGFGAHQGRVTSVITDHGNIACDYAIVAAGPFTGQILSLAGINLPISPRVRQRLVLPDAPEVPSNAPMTIDEDTGSHWRPEGGGAYVLRPDPTAPSGPPALDPQASRGFYDLLLDPDSEVAVAKHAPFWRDVWARRTQHWYVTAGQYSYSPDHMPLLGPTSIPNLGVNGGYSGHGIMASPAGSRIAVDTLLGVVDNQTNPFRASRDFPQQSSAKHSASGGQETGIQRGPL
ncbi:MAG: FAD-binding oxidoreductase [Chloroflexi bacterium]|nr:FAD-binding oxidoreductase [Chloroflexota bacterium]